jgi:hypothetical protein
MTGVAGNLVSRRLRSPKEGVCVDLRTQRVYVEGRETQEVLTDQQYRGLSLPGETGRAGGLER